MWFAAVAHGLRHSSWFYTGQGVDKPRVQTTKPLKVKNKRKMRALVLLAAVTSAFGVQIAKINLMTSAVTSTGAMCLDGERASQKRSMLSHPVHTLSQARLARTTLRLGMALEQTSGSFGMRSVVFVVAVLRAFNRAWP